MFQASLGTLRSQRPLSIYELLDTATRNISVDADWSFGEMRKLALDLRSMPAQQLNLVTAPVRGLGREGDQSVVYLDQAGNQALWNAVRDDEVVDWVTQHAENVVRGPVS